MGISDYLKKSTKLTAHSDVASTFYAGSKLLQPMADASGMQLDQINLLVSLTISMFLAMFFRIGLVKAGPIVRHIVELVAGISLLYFCFGDQIIYVFLQATISYLIMRFAPGKNSHIFNFVFLFGYLSTAHIYRQIVDYGGYTMDITLPLMMLTQRLTSLAFSVNDGLTADVNALPHDQRFFAVTRFPSLLEFYSYTFYFHGILCGPFVHYADYISFIECRNWTRFEMPQSKVKLEPEESGIIGNMARPSSEIATVRVQLLHPPKGQEISEEQMPMTHSQLLKSSFKEGFRVFIVAFLCGSTNLILAPFFPISSLTDPEFHANNSFLFKSFFCLGFIQVTKLRYYFAWKYSDAINIFSGLSYSGITKQGKALWRLTDNIDIREFELGLRFAVHINAWNKTTSNWLRFMIYDRATWHPTLVTFTISALWHGFYPGYYIAFLTAALFLNAVRVVRSVVRPVMERKTVPRWMYDIVAFILVRFASGYMALPFLMMTLKACFDVYRSLYFWPHILAIFALLVVPRLRRFLPESLRQKKVYGRARVKKQEATTSSIVSEAALAEAIKPRPAPSSPSRQYASASSGDDFDSDIDPLKPKAE